MRWADLGRLLEIARVALGHLVMHRWGGRWGFVLRRPWLARRLPAADLSGPERLRTALEDLGGTFIKLGQMLAVQPDIFSLEHSYALFKLLDRVEPFAYGEVERIVREELGRGPEEAFDRFERRPVASASIGQVHRAWLGDRVLAVKVQRPTVDRDFGVDLRLMAGAIWTIRTLRLRFLDFMVEPLSEFISWTREELDFTREARYQARLREISAGNPRSEVPGVVPELTTSRVLVMDYLDGVPVSEHLRSLESGEGSGPRAAHLATLDGDAFARAIIDNFLGDAFRHGLFHADPHPANLLIMPGNVVGYIDFGITGILSSYARRHLIAMTLAYTRGDLEGMSAAFFRVSAMERRADVDAFRCGLSRLAEGWYERRGRDLRLLKSFTMMMLDMLHLSRATGIWPERDVIKYIRSSIVLDGLVNRFSPGFDVGRYLERACARQVLGRGLRQALLPEQVLDWAVTVVELGRDGPGRVGALVDRAIEGEVTVRAEGAAPELRRASALRARLLGLTAFVAGSGLVVALGGGVTEVGWNVSTAALLLLLAGSAVLFDTARRMA